MKKRTFIFVLICLFCLVLSGCGKKADLDLNAIEKSLASLEKEEINVQGIASLVDEKEYFKNATYIYEYDFEELFGINPENLEEFSVELNKDTKEMYAVFLPKDGKKEEIKKKMSDYFSSLEKNEKEEIQTLVKNRLEKEYDSHLIYVLSSTNNNDEIYQAIIHCKSTIYPNLQMVDDELLENSFDIKKEDVEEYKIGMPLIITSASGYYILKPAQGKIDIVKEKMNDYMEKLENQWKTYLPDQYDLVKNRKEETYGDYLIYIISSDNEAVYKEITSHTLDK